MAHSWLWRFAQTRLQPLWGDEGAGVLWLTLGVGVTFILGLVLQLLSLRTLNAGGYATFVFALGIGNIAHAVASAVQPVVAARATTDQAAFLPVSWQTLALAAGLLTPIVVMMLSPAVGWRIALLAVAQVPLHVTVAVGLGRLQAQRQFARLAACLALWSAARCGVATLAIITESGSPTAFVAALPLALLAEAGMLWVLGAYRGCDLRPTADGKPLVTGYALWALFAWLLNADAVFAPRVFSPADADAYAMAFTLGRQPVYAIAPLTTVLLPVTLALDQVEQRPRLFAVLGVTAVLLVGTLVVLGARPNLILALLTGDPASTSAVLLRGYAIIGSVAAGAALLMTFAFALGCPPRLQVLGGLAFSYLLVTAAFVSRPLHLLFAQGSVIFLVAAFSTVNVIRATSAKDSLLPRIAQQCEDRTVVLFKRSHQS